MKQTILLLSLSILLISDNVVFSQGIDKPQYQVITRRAGTYLGTFNIELFPLIAPLHVNNFDSLVSEQFYDSTAFHRVVPGFVIQGGDPNSISGPISTWGQGQPWQPTVPAEFSVVRHLRGILGAARDVDTNSANSQFYICVANATFLDGDYTVYGKVISGMDIVDTIVNSPRDANDVPLQKIDMFVTYTGVNDSVPDAPILTSPANAAAGILNIQTFVWSIVQSAVMYTIEFSTDPAFSTIDFWTNSGVNSAIMPLLEGSTTYYWRVKSNNGGHESSYSNAYSFTTATAAPQLIYPADLSTGISVDPVFQWSTVPGATDYTLQVSTSSVFIPANFVFNQSGISGTSQQVIGLNNNFVYYWRVRSASGATQGFYSLKYSFTTETATGIHEIQSVKSFAIKNIFPNPANQKLNIDLNFEKNGVVNFIIADESGRVVLKQSEEFTQGDAAYAIDVRTLSKGFYVLSVLKDGNEIKVKFGIN